MAVDADDNDVRVTAQGRLKSYVSYILNLFASVRSSAAQCEEARSIASVPATHDLTRGSFVFSAPLLLCPSISCAGRKTDRRRDSARHRSRHQQGGHARRDHQAAGAAAAPGHLDRLLRDHRRVSAHRGRRRSVRTLSKMRILSFGRIAVLQCEKHLPHPKLRVLIPRSVTRVRRVSSVTIRLSKVELDPTDPGYQAPAPLSDGQIADPTAAAAAAAQLYALAEAARPAATVVSSATANAVGLAIDTAIDASEAGGAAGARNKFQLELSLYAFGRSFVFVFVLSFQVARSIPFLSHSSIGLVHLPGISSFIFPRNLLSSPRWSRASRSRRQCGQCSIVAGRPRR